MKVMTKEEVGVVVGVGEVVVEVVVILAQQASGHLVVFPVGFLVEVGVEVRDKGQGGEGTGQEGVGRGTGTEEEEEVVEEEGGIIIIGVVLVIKSEGGKHWLPAMLLNHRPLLPHHLPLLHHHHHHHHPPHLALALVSED